MKSLKSGYVIRSAHSQDLPQLAHIEQSAATRFLNSPYPFLSNAKPLPLDFMQQQFQAGQVWVATNRQNTPIGFAITREIDHSIYLQEIDVEPKYGQKGIGSALIATIQTWAKQSGYTALSLSTFCDIPWNAPFYAKLGFRILNESELSPSLQQIRQQEQDAGLPIADRVIMQWIV